MTAAARLIDRLHRVKRTRPGSWAAACPCCESRKGRPITVTEKDDGRALIHAFCGCSTADVLGRVGLTVADLFDQPLAISATPSIPRVPAADILKTLSEEVSALAIIAADFLEKKEIDEATWNRLATAARRIGHAADYAKAK